MLYCHCFPASL